ncbi:MAG: hypothetical protein Q9216_002753 [Gyalolechia sp. 2 TL-2023]
MRAMAPLAELSVNRPGKAKQTSFNGTSITFGKRQPPSSLPESNATSLPTASAIQSMLKNTTELGDAGQFAAKSTKIPRYKTNPTIHTREKKHYQPRRPYATHAEEHRILQRHYYSNQNDPREHSLRDNHSSRTNGRHSLISDSQDQRSDSITQSSNTSRRVSVHPSLLNIRPYGRVGPRPRSPYAYPSRLRRPGYRPSSPGYSEINVSDSALFASVQRTYSTRTESPNSAMRKGAQAWDHSFNQSDPLLRYYPALALSRRHDRHRSPPFLRRAALRSSPLASHRSSPIGKPRALKASNSGSSGERAASPAPLFYDYSEAFEKESFRHTAQRSSMFESRHIPQSDGSSEGYQADVTNTSSTSTKCSGSSTKSKAISPKQTGVAGKRPSPLRFVPRILKQQAVEHNKASVDIGTGSSASSDIIINPSDDATLTKDLLKTEIPSVKAYELLAAEAGMTDRFDGCSVAQCDLQRPPSTYDPAPKVIKTAAVTMRLSSSSSGSQYSLSTHSRPDPNIDSPTLKAPDVIYERQPKALSVSFDRLETIRRGIPGGEPQLRAASLDTHGRSEPFQIFSPVPERSMSSRDSRDRFSRILSIGEDSCQRDLFASTLSNKKAPMTIQQYLRDRKVPVHKAKASPTKELPPLPDDPPSVSSKGKEKEIEESRIDHDTGQHLLCPRQTPIDGSETYSISGVERVTTPSDFRPLGIPPRFSSISRDSLLALPESSRSIRESTLSQKQNEEQNRRFAMTPRNSSLFQTLKDLPPLPKEHITSMLPLREPSPPGLPCLLTPLISEEQLGSTLTDLKGNSNAQSSQQKAVTGMDSSLEKQTPPRTTAVGYRPEQGLNESPASVRPWNLDASYPWAGTPPKLEVSLPQPTEEAAPQAERFPRFKFNVHRSSILGTSGKLLKPRPANIKVFPAPDTGRQIIAVHARFANGLDRTKDIPPRIALLPPSPGLQIEAQSFFSDDSSQRRRKGSLRRRFSQMKGAIRTGSSDDIRASERANVSSALGLSRGSKGSSKRSSIAPQDNAPQKITKWGMFQKIKSWFLRKEEKIKKWSSKFGPRRHPARSFGAGRCSGM